eukprot:jgi/Galph1/415/GphlegSOOS_G5283.1
MTTGYDTSFISSGVSINFLHKASLRKQTVRFCHPLISQPSRLIKFPSRDLRCTAERLGALDRSLASEKLEQATLLINDILNAEGNGIESVAKTMERFYDAINRRDFDTVRALWLYSDHISCAHVLCEELICGYDAVIETWSTYLQSATTELKVKNERIYIRGLLAWVTHEVVAKPLEVETPDEYLSVDFLATNVLQWSNNEWFLMHHHASPL